MARELQKRENGMEAVGFSNFTGLLESTMQMCLRPKDPRHICSGIYIRLLNLFVHIGNGDTVLALALRNRGNADAKVRCALSREKPG